MSPTTDWLRGSRPVALALAAFFVLAHCPAQAEPVSGAQAESGRCWAVLIGVDKYQVVSARHFTANDIRQLGQTLRSHAGYAEACVLEITDEGSDPRYQPLKARIEAALPDRLRRAEPADTVLVYFGGHAFRDPAGKIYLGPSDCNPAELAKTGIPIQWLRQQIIACKAKVKLLVLDACQEDYKKGEVHPQSVTSNDLGEPFWNLAGVVTLASSSGKEHSQIWEEKRQSLFGYWLNQGLRGHADENGDGTIDIDELYKYVSRNVIRTAKARLSLVQTPIEIVRPGSAEVPVVAHLQALTLRQVIADMAEQLANSIEERKLNKVGVLEFTNDTKQGELLGADFGLLGRYFAEELERRLAEQGSSRFNLVERRRLQSVLRERGFKLTDLGSIEALKRLAHAAGGMPTIALGTLRDRTERVMNVRCRLVSTESDELAGSAGGTAVLSESEWAMLGRSVVVRPEYRKTETPVAGQPARSPEAQLVHHLEVQSSGPHPMADPKFLYPVKLMINGEERKGEFRGNDYYLPVRKGEVYEIWVENRSTETVLMRLLVDGLNTLPEKETLNSVVTLVSHKRVNLGEARHWELDPADGPVYAVRGFVTAVGATGKLREFTVTDLGESLAGRQKFTDQIGIITAAFYAPVAASGDEITRGLGTGLGKERSEEILKAHVLKPGNLLSVVHLRYVDTDALARSPK